MSSVKWPGDAKSQESTATFSKSRSKKEEFTYFKTKQNMRMRIKTQESKETRIGPLALRAWAS
jgi:hypothetical protein